MATAGSATGVAVAVGVAGIVDGLRNVTDGLTKAATATVDQEYSGMIEEIAGGIARTKGKSEKEVNEIKQQVGKADTFLGCFMPGKAVINGGSLIADEIIPEVTIERGKSEASFSEEMNNQASNIDSKFNTEDVSTDKEMNDYVEQKDGDLSIK